MSVVHAELLSKQYGETTAVDGISLDIEAGEIYGLLGPNGAGKTTLIRLLTGITSPTGGEASLLGVDPATVDSERIGVIPQNFQPAERLSASELVSYYGGLYSNPADSETILERVGLTEAADTRYRALSGGQQRRLAVGIGLVNDPEVLFLDEPTTGIDPAGRRQIWEILETLSEEGATILLTTHYMDEAERLADRVGLVSDGALVAEGTPAGLVEAHGGEAITEIELTEAIEGSPTLQGTWIDPTTLRVSDCSIDDLDAVIEAIVAAGGSIESLAWHRASLEDVYLTLTEEAGRSRP